MTLLSGYAANEVVEGLEEVVPEKFRRAVSTMDDYDYLGKRIRNEFVAMLLDGIHMGSEVGALLNCNSG